MRITTTQPLFAWECLDDSPSLRTIREFLRTVPDAKLLNALHRWRGRGRDGTLGRMRLSVVAQALRKKLTA